MTSNYIFITLSTPDKYLDALTILLESFKLTQSGNVQAEIGCLGWDDQLIAGYRKKYPGFHFQLLDFRPVGRPKEQAIRWKPRFFLQVLEQVPPNSTLIFTDADHIILNDLSDLFQKMSQFDIGLRRRPEHQGRNLKYAAGIFGAVKNAAGQQAINHWNKLIDNSPDEWFVDQTSLVDLAGYCQKNQIHLWNMDDSTLSIDTGNRNAYIWARSNWELEFEDRMSDNLKILKELS